MTVELDHRMCYRKKRYPSEAKARKYRNRIRAERGVELRIYCCPVCLGYHLTKQTPGGNNERR